MAHGAQTMEIVPYMDLPIPDLNLQPSSHKSHTLPTDLSGFPIVEQDDVVLMF